MVHILMCSKYEIAHKNNNHHTVGTSHLLNLIVLISVNKLPKILYLPILNNGRSVKVHVLVGRALLKGDFFLCEYDVIGVTDLLVLLVVDGTFLGSTFFC